MIKNLVITYELIDILVIAIVTCELQLCLIKWINRRPDCARVPPVEVKGGGS